MTNNYEIFNLTSVVIIIRIDDVQFVNYLEFLVVISSWLVLIYIFLIFRLDHFLIALRIS